MSWEYVYSTEDLGDGSYGIFNETSITGHIVFTLPCVDSANFYKDVMNEVYNQVKSDVERGFIVRLSEDLV